MKPCDTIRTVLEQIDRADLARLLEYSSYSLESEEGLWSSPEPVLYVSAPEPCFEAITGSSKSDQTRIIEAAKRADPVVDAYGTATIQLTATLDRTRQLTPDESLLAELVVERNILISVATGGPRINDVDDYYRARRGRIGEALTRLGIADPNPFPSLWDWYKHWSATFQSYSERRAYVHGLYRPLLRTLSVRPIEVAAPREPTGWVRVDRVLAKARYQLARARTEEDFQAVGLLCREILISVGQAVYDPEVHSTSDGVTPSGTDAKRQLEAFFSATLAGDVFEATRKHARAALDMAVALQHKRTADSRFAALCLEATASVVTVVAIVSGRAGAS